MHILDMNNHNILPMLVLLLTILVLTFHPQTNFVFPHTFAQLPIPSVKPNPSDRPNSTTTASLSNHTSSISIHTLNTIQANNFNLIKQEEPAVRKAVLSDIDHVIFIAKGGAKSTIPVSVNARIINQLANSRTDTTQGVNMTKSLVATELANAINTISANSKLASQNAQQPSKVIVDNQATCSGIATPTSASCAFIIIMHS
jgi:hypothetical protein